MRVDTGVFSLVIVVVKCVLPERISVFFYSGIYCDHIEDIVVFHPSLAAHRLTQRYGNLRRPFQEWENEIVEV